MLASIKNCMALNRFSQILTADRKKLFSDFKGRSYRLLKLDEMDPEVLEGMDLLQEKRAEKWMKEGEERAKRRSEGIMYDECDIGEGKIRYLYEREYKELHSQDKESKQFLGVIVGSLILGASAFVYVRMDLMKRRKKAMLERKMKTLEERKKKAIVNENVLTQQ